MPSDGGTSVIGPDSTSTDTTSSTDEKLISEPCGPASSSPDRPDNIKASSKNGLVPPCEWEIGRPVVVRHGHVKGVADLYSWVGDEVIVYFPDGRGFIKVEPQDVVSG